MGVYDEEIQMVLDDVEEFGQSVTWRQISNGSPVDSSKPWNVGSSVNTDNTVNILFIINDLVNKQTQKYDSDINKSGNLNGVMGKTSFTPDLKDVVIRNGKELNLSSISEISPNGEIIAYRLEFKT